MPEQVLRLSRSIEIHLLYASVVWLAAWLLTSLRRGSATTKYWIWVATSANFLLPLSLVPDQFWPSRLSWFSARGVAGRLGSGIALSGSSIAILGLVWFLGAALMFARLCLRVRADRRETSAATDKRSQGAHNQPILLTHGVPVRFASDRRGPAVDGVVRPRISLPEGIDRVLTEPELEAVLIHELEHAKRRDNLVRLIHEVSLCGLWFHPLVWITGSRLALYREISCDEAVTRRASSGDLVSALAKLAEPRDPPLLQATASSFLRRRLAWLTAADPRRSLAANAILSAAFGAVLLAAALGPAARSAAAAACARSSAPAGIASGGSGGVHGAKGAIRHGVSRGLEGGVHGARLNGIRGGVN